MTLQKWSRLRTSPCTWTCGNSASGVQLSLPALSGIGSETASLWLRFQTSFLSPVGLVRVSLRSRW